MSLNSFNDRVKHEIRFTNFCKNAYNRDSFDHTQSWLYMHKDLARTIITILKDPTTQDNTLKEWIKNQGFLIGTDGIGDTLCICVKEKEGPVSMNKCWKQVAVVEDYFNIIWKHHCTHSNAINTHNKLSQVYHGVPMNAVEAFVSSCPECQSMSSTSPSDSVPNSNDPKSVITNGDSGSNSNNTNRSSRKFMRKGQVELIPAKDSVMASTSIAIYMDTWSNYHVLFSLVDGDDSPAQFAAALIKRVFPYYGVPCNLVSTLGYDFVEELIIECTKAWPDAVAIINRCKKSKNSMVKRAKRSKLLIQQVLNGCGQELLDVELSPSATEDLLLSIQYKLNVLVDKKTRNCAYEMVFNRLPVPGPLTTQLLSHRDLVNGTDIDSNSDGERVDVVGVEMGGVHSGACLNSQSKSEDDNQAQSMNRIAQKTTFATGSSGGNSTGNTAHSHQQLQQMLAAGTIQAQEQQVTSLRELLKQEEKRLEVLKQMRSGPKSSKKTAVDPKHGVIRSTHAIAPATTQETTSATPISSRLQQLVDSVAVNQASQLKSSIQVAGRSSTQQTTHAATSQNGIQTIQKAVAELDEATILKTIENSPRYREFVLKQSNLKRNFQKQIDKKIGSAAYPKTFRQVWPIIPVHDASFIKNIGLEAVTMYFDPSYASKPNSTQPTKIKPTCNQCGCDFASAWQIRKNNSKQVLLCEACDFTNLKLFQRSKLANQLKDLMESVQKDEEKFSTELEEAKKHTIAVEKVNLLNAKPLQHHQPPPIAMKHDLTMAGSVNHVKKLVNPVIANGSSISSGQGLTSTATGKMATIAPATEDVGSRKRKSLEEHGVSKVAKTSANLDRTLSKISQQLVRKQVDEKVGKRKQSPSDTEVSSSTKLQHGPPPLKQASPVKKTAPVSLPQPHPLPEPVQIKSTPPPLVNNNEIKNIGGSDSRKSRRKGTPRHKIMGNE